MLDIRFIRSHPDVVRRAIEVKQVDLDLDALLEADARNRALTTELQELQAERKATSRRFRSTPKEQHEAIRARAREIGERIAAIKKEQAELAETLRDLMLRVPNIPWEGAPVGDAEANAVVRRWGEPRAFDFEPRDHVELLEINDWAELERVARISGSRNYALKGDMVRLELAVHLFMMDLLGERGFTPMTVPTLVREAALVGTGHFPSGREDIYAIPRDDLFLSGTAEVVLTSLHAGEILDESQLPILMSGLAPCYRREAGSAGRDVRGLLRVHQFLKTEQYVICRNDPEESARWHAALLDASERLLQALELPYQVVECATADMGTGKFRMNDIETWVPTLGRYRETHSCSTLHDWQARRANLRYRDADGKVRFVHTLNNTGAATPRLLVPLLENHQLADGRVRVPEALRPYLGGREVLGRGVA